MVEYASTNPLHSLRLRHTATVLLIQQIQVYGALRGKNMLCFPRDKSIYKLLMRAGAVQSPSTCVYFKPGADPGVELAI